MSLYIVPVTQKLRQHPTKKRYKLVQQIIAVEGWHKASALAKKHGTEFRYAPKDGEAVQKIVNDLAVKYFIKKVG